MLEFIVAGIVLGVLFAGFIWVVIGRAVDHAFDWIILTFGNAEAVERLNQQRGWDRGAP
jgi:hypothetical protein